MSETIFAGILNVLGQRGSQKPWMTSKTIAKRLGSKVSSSEVEKLLFAHCSKYKNQQSGRKVRYSSLPSRKTLEVLWGDIKRVGDRKLENLAKDDIADDSLGEFEGQLHLQDIFVSHSHKDYQDVLLVAHHLMENGVFPWLAETHIEQGETINERIIAALDSRICFLLFLTPDALESRWTGKEYLYAKNNDLKVFVLINVDHEDVLKILDPDVSIDASAKTCFSDKALGFLKSVEQNVREERIFLFSNDKKFNFKTEKFQRFSTLESLPKAILQLEEN